MSSISLPIRPKVATRYLVELIIDTFWPLISEVRKQLISLKNDNIENGDIIKESFSLCCSQIKKSLVCLLHVFQVEIKQQISLQETRQCLVERLSWCIIKLNSIRNISNQVIANNFKMEDCDESLLTIPMYFVNWIDHTFEILTKLSELVYKEYDNEEESFKWKDDVVGCVSEVHVTLDELLLSAMTLCRYCLPNDQKIINTRCQVVLREAKSLISEIVNGDINSGYQVTKDSLRLPFMPSNVNILIDVLKDVLYALETNINTALLTLLIHCFSKNCSPMKIMKDHLAKTSKGICSCGEDIEACDYIKEFDLYNERLLQIGSFAVSCSADQNRLLTLRSGLASLESLDPHLVPALITAPLSHHAELLSDSWTQEVNEIRNTVFLIVDPMAFTERIKQLMHQSILQLIEEGKYNNKLVCSIINMAVTLYDLFKVYQKCEPEALEQLDDLGALLSDLHKVINECKTVSNLLCKDHDDAYDVRVKIQKEVSFDQVLKRIKLLYHLVNKINNLYKPIENEEHLFHNDICEEPMINNATQTLRKNIAETYINSPQKANNMTKSIFARSTNIKSSSNLALTRLSSHLSLKRNEKLSFSVQLNELFNFDNLEIESTKDMSSRKHSILYKFEKKNRNSLRKAVLNKNNKVDSTLSCAECVYSGNDDIVDDATSLQITEILDQMSDMSNLLTNNTTKQTSGMKFGTPKSVLKLNINKAQTPLAKQIWNIPIDTTVDICLDDTNNASCTSINSSVPSNVTTLERINDLDIIECKLSNLKMLTKETRL